MNSYFIPQLARYGRAHSILEVTPVEINLDPTTILGIDFGVAVQVALDHIGQDRWRD